MPITDPRHFGGQGASFVEVTTPEMPPATQMVPGVDPSVASPMFGGYMAPAEAAYAAPTVPVSSYGLGGSGYSGYGAPSASAAQQAVMLGYQNMRADAYDMLQRVKIGAVYGAHRAYEDVSAFGQSAGGYLERSPAPTYDPQQSTFFGSVAGVLGLSDLARNETPGTIRTDAARDLAERTGVMAGAGFTELALPGAAFGVASALFGGPVGMAVGLGASLGMDAFINADLFRDHLARGGFIEQSSGRYMRPGVSTDADGSGFTRV